MTIEGDRGRSKTSEHRRRPHAGHGEKPRRIRRIVTVVASTLAVFSVASLSLAPAFAQDDIGLPVGAMAPASVPVEDLNGQPANLSEYIGKKPVLIEFWATWCPLCRALVPKIEAAHEKYGDRMEFVVVAVAVNQSKRSVKRHLEEHAMSFKFVWDAKGAAVRAFEAPSTSYIVAIDATGKVAYTGLGDKQDIEAAVRKAMGQ